MTFYFNIEKLTEVDPIYAATFRLSEYLKTLVFKNQDHVFKFNYVNTEWPEPGQQLDYPCASIIESESTKNEYNFTPAPLEETYNLFEKDTVLWKTGEMVAKLQLDIFASNPSERSVILNTILARFSDTEIRSGVVLYASENYFCRPIRYTIESFQKIDSSILAFERERRAMIEVRCELDIVQLRQVKKILKVNYNNI